MRKALIVMSLALMLQDTGSFVGGLINVVTLQGQPSQSRASWTENDQMIRDGNDPSGMAVTG